MESMDRMLDLVATQLAGIAGSDAVVGAPVKVGGVTLVPLARVSMGLGGGGGEGEGEGMGPHGGHGPHGHGPHRGRGFQGQGKGQGVGSGGGAKARPVAVLAFTDAGVQVLKVPDRLGPIERFLERLPDLVERFSERHGSRRPSGD